LLRQLAYIEIAPVNKHLKKIVKFLTKMTLKPFRMILADADAVFSRLGYAEEGHLAQHHEESKA